MAHQPIEELDLFHLFESVADWSWEQVSTWKNFERDTLGKQLITAIDSVNANLVEGDGRYSLQDSIRFFVIARASARESRLWIRRAEKRNLLPKEDAEAKIEDLTRATRLLNLLITYRRGAKSSFVKESISAYGGVEANSDPFV